MRGRLARGIFGRAQCGTRHAGLGALAQEKTNDIDLAF